MNINKKQNMIILAAAIIAIPLWLIADNLRNNK